MEYTAAKLNDLAIGLVKEAEQRGNLLRLLGGLAIFLSSPNGRQLAGLKRNYKDLDFVVDSKGARALNDVFIKQGWKEDHYFNALHGATRMLYYYEDSLQADIFVSVFEQCHKLNFEKRLALNSPTIPLADLLLTKLQIHQLNQKDIQDIVMLAYDHDFGLTGIPSEKAALDFIVSLTSQDWGWYTTIHDNLLVIQPQVKKFVDGPEAERVEFALSWICTNIEKAPKTIIWKLRDQIGRKVQWYEEPEEVNR